MIEFFNFQIFENNSITNIEVKNIISDVLVELGDIRNFSWHVYIAEDQRNLLHFPENEPFKNCHDYLIFDNDKGIYICVNSNPIEYNIPTLSLVKEQFDIDVNPLYFYINKNTLKPTGFSKEIPISDHQL